VTVAGGYLKEVIVNAIRLIDQHCPEGLEEISVLLRREAHRMGRDVEPIFECVDVGVGVA
jgi:hypothetical protein